MSKVNKTGNIYLIKLCDTLGRCIYKVGKSQNIENRIKSYNYCEILVLIKSDNIENDESNIIKIFTRECKLDKGKDFFTCPDENKVIILFMNYFTDKHKNVNDNILDIKKEEIKEEVKKKEEIKKEVKKEIKLVKRDRIKKHKISDYICPKCNVDFKYKSIYKRHINKKFKCNVENKVNTNDIKKINENLITISKIILTNLNNKELNEQFNRITKNEIENNNKHYICNQCNKTYTQRQNLYRHKKTCSDKPILNNADDSKNLYKIKEKAYKLKDKIINKSINYNIEEPNVEE